MQIRAIVITPLDGGKPFRVNLKGRALWAMLQLMKAGPEGITPIERPAPRWSAYIHKLRGKGITIETINEPHGGAFSGTHGRYVLRCDARLIRGDAR